MEFVSGYRDEFLDFTALLFGWFRKFVAERGTVGTSLEGHWQQLEAQIRRLPQDSALWVLHVLPNRSVGISLGQGGEPGPGSGLGAARLLGDEPPLHLRDLSPYVSFVSLEDGEEGEEGEEEDEEEENGEEDGAGTEKVESQEDGEPAPINRECPQEAKPAGEPEVTEQKAGDDDGCLEDRGSDEIGTEKRKGQRSGKNPGLTLPYPLPSHLPILNCSTATQNPVRSHKLVVFDRSGLNICFHRQYFFYLNQYLNIERNKKPEVWIYTLSRKNLKWFFCFALGFCCCLLVCFKRQCWGLDSGSGTC
jgi:hypothetical protein